MGAIGDPYITVADLAQATGETDDGTFTDIVNAVSRAIELFTGRQFNRAEVATARRFRAVDWCRVAVDDFWTTDGLLFDIDGSSSWDVTDVDPRPWDGIHKGQPGWPFFDLFTVDRFLPTRAFRRRAIVNVTAQWGWESVPSAASRAALALAVDDQSDGSSGPVKAEQIGQYSVSYQSLTLDHDDLASLVDLNTRAAALLSPYRRVSPFGIA